VADKWFSECLPCGWETQHDDEDSAIRAAVKHVNSLQSETPPEVRGDKKMGHVQSRTVGALATQLSPAPAPAPALPGEGAMSGSSATSQAPEHSPVIDITTASGEHVTIKE